MGGVVTDTNCQRASQSLYETIAVFLFARLPPRALLAASPLARDSCSATFPRGFSSKRETARSLVTSSFVARYRDCRRRSKKSTCSKSSRCAVRKRLNGHLRMPQKYAPAMFMASPAST